MFIEAFSELPQKVLWKWESDTIPGKPPNVRVQKWLPQQDILGIIINIFINALFELTQTLFKENHQMLKEFRNGWLSMMSLKILVIGSLRHTLIYHKKWKSLNVRVQKWLPQQ